MIDETHLEIGKEFVYEITGTNGGSLWDLNIYKCDSDVATVAVHAGILTIGQTKPISLKIVQDQ